MLCWFPRIETLYTKILQIHYLTILCEITNAECSFIQLQTLIWEIDPVGTISPIEDKQMSTQEQVEFSQYPESDYKWLIEVLETLTDIVDRNFSNNFATLTENDYERLDSVLKELIYVVGDDEKHQLAPLMEFICILIADYENRHFPKLTDLFPDLKEDEIANNIGSEVQKDNSNTALKSNINSLAAEAFYSIGTLLYDGRKREEAIFAHGQAIKLGPDYIHAYLLRG